MLLTPLLRALSGSSTLAGRARPRRSSHFAGAIACQIEVLETRNLLSSAPAAVPTATAPAADSTIIPGYVAGMSGNLVVRGGFLFDGSTYVSFQVPGATGQWISGVSGTRVVGWFTKDPDPYTSGDNNHGFIFDVSTSTLTTFDAGPNTQIQGISGNLIWGNFGHTNHTQLFLYDGTQFINPKMSIVAGSGNDVVGYSGVVPGDHNVLFDGSTYTSLDVPGEYSSQVTAISNGVVVGFYLDSAPVWVHAETPPGGVDLPLEIFVPTANHYGYRYDGTTFTTIDFPGASNTVLTGVWKDSSGNVTVVGTYQDSDWTPHDFVYDGTTFTTIDLPGFPAGNPSISGSTVLLPYYATYYYNLQTLLYQLPAPPSGDPGGDPGTLTQSPPPIALLPPPSGDPGGDPGTLPQNPPPISLLPLSSSSASSDPPPDSRAPVLIGQDVTNFTLVGTLPEDGQYTWVLPDGTPVQFADPYFSY